MAITYAGTTALVTGASSGLGEEFARQLAARGADLILVARRKDRLETLAAELKQKHGTTVTVIPADLSTADAAADLADRVRASGLTVHTLINNAGFGTSGPFENEDPARILQEVDLNVRAVVAMSKAFYGDLLAHGRGALINVASTAGYQSLPYMAVYGATKAFVLSFTEALWKESQKSGLRVLALSPGATRTEFFDVAGHVAHTGPTQSPAAVVGLALRTLDRRNPPPSIVSGAGNRFMSRTPRWVTRRMSLAVASRVSRSLFSAE